MQNEIKREISINASQKRVYEAIANPELVVKWFPDAVEGNYVAGQYTVFKFGDCGRTQIYVKDAKPYDYFAYRWVPGAHNFDGDVLTVPNTLVEFFVEATGDNSCKVILTESGFASLPADIMENSFNQNSKGWDHMMSRLPLSVEGAK
ncbi:SRPBCC domain-containing protein [Neptunicella marina]|uniref:SRPBCC domain-containing protein n=1 Tax=Neptunicella marina TaxID=2125989 RepID=A0A8J6LV81_9ALTE|nr:SRPBCC domain-containing protein [Neptunicella marina]MBC3764409.1 SRPBCC domain-containing protein [Neptunicella marina]